MLTNSYETHKEYITQINILESSEKSENDVNELLVELRDKLKSIKGRIQTLSRKDYELNSKVKSLQRARGELINKTKNKHGEEISSCVSDDGINNSIKINDYYGKNGILKILDKKISENNSKLEENNKLFTEACNESNEIDVAIEKGQQYIWETRKEKNTALKELRKITDNMVNHLYIYINRINSRD